MMAHPVCLRMCTEELYIVSEKWWRRFLLSQEKALSTQKIPLDTRTERTSISSGSTITNVNLEPREETGRREQRHAAG